MVKDPTTQKYFRFLPTQAAGIRLLDGTRAPEDVAAAMAEQGVAISAGAVEAFVRTLSRMHLLEHDLAERMDYQLERLRTERRRRRSLFRGEWLRMRWAFGDANGFFDRIIPYVQWCFTRGFVIASVALFATYAWILTTRWGAFSAAVSSTYAPAALTVGGVGILVVTLVTLTLLHELGHGFACKYFGGEVHELGFMILYFSPAFYCNVNDAWSFPELRSRLWVTAAGAWVELLCTALAAITWIVARPETLLAHFALAAMLIGGFMTIVTNGNPLMPLDGYFALSDYLEVPNLRHRAAGYLTWWFRRHLLRIDMPEPDVAPNERRLFLWYGVLSLLYGSLFISWIALKLLGFATATIGLLGGLLVVLVIVALLRTRLLSVWRAVVLAVRAQTGGARWRRWRRRGPLILLAAVAMSAVIPWDLKSGGGFRVAAVRSQAVAAADSGVVSEIFANTGASIAAGAPLLRILNLDALRTLATETRSVDSLTILEQKARAGHGAGPDAQLSAERLAAEAGVAATRGRVAQQLVRARINGVVATEHPEWLLGRRVGPGDTLLVVYDPSALEARITLAAAGSSRIEPGQRVRLIAYQALDAPIDAVVTSVGSSSSTQRFGAIEARVTLPPGTVLRVGATGEAKVWWRHSTLLGALWWAVRSRIQGGLLL